MSCFKTIIGFFLLFLLFTSCKKQSTVNTDVLNDVDLAFVVKSAIYDSAEIRTAQLALSKTTDSVIMSFASYMLAEHTTTRKDIKVMGGVVGFTIKDSIDDASIAIISTLNTLSGREFDSAYVHTRLDNQAATESFFIDAITNGNQKNVNSFASSNLERIRLQYARADSIAKAFY